MTHFNLALLLGCAPLAAMAAPVGKGDSGLLSVITFATDSVNQNRDLDFSEDIYVRYDLARILGSCGATETTPNTTVTAFYSLNSKTTTETLLSTSATPKVSQSYFGIPKQSGAGSLSLWFSCAVTGGKAVYDSNFGKNFNFNVLGGMIGFKKDSKTEVLGEIKAGKPLQISYDPARSPCVVKAEDP
ncbi:hypothetical protein HDU67_003715, partial [Dinochytrium kinnereticum]